MSVFRGPSSVFGLMRAGVALTVQLVVASSLYAQLAPGNTAGAGLSLNDAIHATLDYGVAIEQSLEAKRIREAERQMAEGAFDITLGLSASAGHNSTLYTLAEQELYGVAASRSRTTTYRFNAAKTFPSGLTISPGIELLRQDALTMRAPPVVRTQAGIRVSYPVLRAGSRTSAAVKLEAAVRQSEATELDVWNTRAVSVLSAASAYWMYRSAYETLDILSASEAKAGRLLDETRALVEGGERPAMDLDQLRADLADRFAARLSAENRLFEARQELGLKMGLTAGEASALPPPLTDFPEVMGIPAVTARDDLLALADRKRYDLARTRKEIEAARASLDARRIDAKPSLDLHLDIGYAAHSERSLSVGTHVPFVGPNDVGRMSTSVAFVLEWPTANNEAAGAAARAEAVLRRARLAEADLERHIASRIQIAIEQLRSSAAELLKTDEAVHLYRSAVEGEQRRLQLGMSTQFDLLLVEERLRNTMLSRVGSAARYARAIALLRFETGTLPGVERTEGMENSIELMLTAPLTNAD